eukprot:3004684-Amphidinium_carterae.1
MQKLTFLRGRRCRKCQPYLLSLAFFAELRQQLTPVWSLFPAACSPPQKIQEDQVSQGRWPKLSKAAGDTSSSARVTFLPRHPEVEEETELLLTAPMVTREPEQADEPNDVRVEEVMDDLEAVVEDRQGTVNMVGTHPCIITAGGTRMACKKCSRYVATYQGKWRNLDTLSRQACKPKAKRQAKPVGKALQKQKGGAQPALPPGTLTKERTKGPTRNRDSRSWRSRQPRCF